MTDCLAELYADFLEQILKENPVSLKQFWPSLPLSGPFEPLTRAFILHLSSSKRCIFPVHTGLEGAITYHSLEEVQFDPVNQSNAIPPALVPVLQANKILLCEAPYCVPLLKYLQIGHSVISPAGIRQALYPVRRNLSYAEAEALVSFFLSTTQKPAEYLDEFQVIPLIDRSTGLLVLGKSNVLPVQYFLSNSHTTVLLQGRFTALVDDSSPHYSFFASLVNAANIFTPDLKFYWRNVSKFLPQSWNGKSTVIVDPLNASEETNPVYEEWVQPKKKGKSRNFGKKPIASKPAVQSVPLSEVTAIANVQLLWKVFDQYFAASPTEIAALFVDWPIVPLGPTEVASIPHCVENGILDTAAFTKDEIELLRKFSVRFCEMTPVLREVLGFKPARLFTALSLWKADSTGSLQDLQTCVLKFIVHSSDSAVLRQLPIFKTFKGKFVSLNMKVFASPGSGPYSVDSEWDNFFAETFSSSLIDFSNPPTAALMMHAGAPRLSVTQFVLSFLLEKIPRISRRQAIFVLAQLYPLKMKSESTIALFSVLKDAQLVIFDDSTRLCCQDVLDSSDPEIQAILGEDIITLPPQYDTAPVLGTMRRLGLLSLSSPNGKGFILAAEAVARTKNVPAGFLLIDHLIDNHKQRLAWPERIYEKIGNIAFVPAIDILELDQPPPGLLSMPQNLSLAKKSTEVTHVKVARKPAADRSLKALMELADEEKGFVGEDRIELNEINPDSIFGAARRLLQSFQQSAPEDEPPFLLTSFSSSAVVSEMAWIGWRNALVFAPQVSRLGSPLLRRLGQPQPPLSLVVGHLQRCCRSWRMKQANDVVIRMRQAVVQLCFLHFHLHLTKFPESRIQLRNVAIPYDDGSWVEMEKILPELDTDLTSDYRAPPDYLKEFSALLQFFGSVAISTTGVRALPVPLNPLTPTVLVGAIASMFNSPFLSDVTVTHPEGTLHLHKFILALQLLFFRSMFEAGMKESSAAAHLIAPEWASWTAIRQFFHYLYTGSPPPLHVNQENADLALQLLRLSDFYLCPFLKDHCQSYLAEHATGTLSNAVELLLTALDCNALPLARYCATLLSQNAAAAQRFPAWANLPPSLQAAIIRGPPFNLKM